MGPSHGLQQCTVLSLPGWQGSGPDHWQSQWQQNFGDRLVEQNDWFQPLRGDWMTRLEDVIQAVEYPVVLVAHSLGCQLVAAWAAHSRFTTRIAAAMLVAPADTERPDMSPMLHGWRPIVMAPLPFHTTVVASSNDPYCSLARADLFAAHWGSTVVNVGPLGHINSESGLGAWPQGRALLTAILNEVSRRTN